MAFSAFSQLCDTLRSKREQEKITTEEMKFLNSYTVDIVRTSGVASAIGGGLAWSASKRLTKLGGLPRFSLAAATAGVVFVAAVDWVSDRVAISCFDHILEQDETRIQKELVNILVRYNEGEPWRSKLMSKHFYSESVDNDEVDRPQILWRRRNAYAESALSSHDKNKAKPQSSQDSSPSSPNRSVSRGSDVLRPKLKLQSSSGNSDGEIVEDPFHCLFGGPEAIENVHAPANPSRSGRAQTRKQRRAHRRQKPRNREASLHSPQYERMWT